MRLMRIGQIGQERPAVLDDEDRCFDLSPMTADIHGTFLEQDGISRVREALESRRLPEIPSVGRIGAPVARPWAVVCIGQNYAAHAAESGDTPPLRPVVFFKHPNTVVGPYDDVVVPRGSEKTDWEVELAAVIGRRARYLDSPEEALAHVAGVAVSNDVSEREFQVGHSGGQWSKGKCCETFNPLGPWLVPLEDVGDLTQLGLRSWVNGEPRQDSVTKDMIFDLPTLIYELSQYMVLEPGDLINTGTPQGVALSGRFGYLKVGDLMELEIDGLGRQRQQLVTAATNA